MGNGSRIFLDATLRILHRGVKTINHVSRDRDENFRGICFWSISYLRAVRHSHPNMKKKYHSSTIMVLVMFVLLLGFEELGRSCWGEGVGSGNSTFKSMADDAEMSVSETCLVFLLRV